MRDEIGNKSRPHPRLARCGYGMEGVPALPVIPNAVMRSTLRTGRIGHEPELTAGHGVRSSARPEMSRKQSDANDPVWTLAPTSF